MKIRLKQSVMIFDLQVASTSVILPILQGNTASSMVESENSILMIVMKSRSAASDQEDNRVFAKEDYRVSHRCKRDKLPRNVIVHRTIHHA